MTWKHVAKKDFEDAIRSKALWVVLFIFVVFAAGGSYALTFLPTETGLRGEVLTSDTAIIALNSVASWLVPIIGLMLGYGAVVGERESGSLKILLSLPHSRANVVLGKMVGRTAVLGVSVFVGFAVAAVVILVTYDRFLPVNYVLFTVLTTLLGTTFISIGVGLSASMKSKTKVIIAVLGFFIFFVFPGLWGWILFGVLFLATGNLPIPGQNYPTWYVFFQRLTPNGAYSPVSNAFMDLGEFEQQVDLSRLLSGTDTVPFYLSEWVALIVLLIWIVVPVVLGYLRFKKADLT